MEATSFEAKCKLRTIFKLREIVVNLCLALKFIASMWDLKDLKNLTLFFFLYLQTLPSPIFDSNNSHAVMMENATFC